MKFSLFAFGLLATLIALPPSDAGAEGRSDGLVDLAIFDTAFTVAGMQRFVARDRAFTAFVPSDDALTAEGTSGLLKGVYLTPGNRERLRLPGLVEDRVAIDPGKRFQ